MKTQKRLLAIALLAALLVSLLPGCSGVKLTQPGRTEHTDFSQGFTAAPSKGELEKVSENDRFTLLVNLKNGEAAVEDKKNGETWYTNPIDKSDDGIASGFHKNALQSVLTMTYTTSQSVEMTCGSFLNSTRKDGLSYRLEEDGSVIFLFDFPNECISIPVRYALGEDCFIAEILTEGIREYGDNVIKSIDFLPFFGAGGTKDEGYLLVPDGSGALIYFNNNRLTASTYKKAFYGFDNGTSDKIVSASATSASSAVSENQYLPVFGISRNDQGFLAIVTEGAARGAVNANVARKYTTYNTVWSTYYYHTIGTALQTQKDGTETVTNVPEKKLETYQNYTVEFHFLEKGSNSYADMADCYRDYLIKTAGLTKQESGQTLPLYLDLYGYIKKTKSFLGIPVEKKIPMTTVEDACAMLDQLDAAGIRNVVVKYNYWAKNSYFDKIPVNAAVDGKVGTAKELLALQKRLAENGGALYLGADLLNVYKTGNGVGKYSGVLRSVSNTTQRQYQFSLFTNAVDSRYDPWYLLRPSLVGKTFAGFAGNLTGAGFENLALDSIGEMLYSELGSSGVGRNQALEIMRDAIASVDGSAKGLMLTGANDYAAVQADHILKAPYKSSGYDLEDISVPFYELVFHGCFFYSLNAVNLSSSPADMTLRYIECGAAPLYSLISRNADELIGSRMDTLYSADASNWMDYITAQYALLREALEPVSGCFMTGHDILSENVRRVSYENGVSIYVNYGTESASVDGLTLSAQGYAVVQNGKVLTAGQTGIA